MIRVLRTATTILILLATIGCSTSAKPPFPIPGQAPVTKQPLKVPAQFPSEAAKLEFTLTAVRDGYYDQAGPLLDQLASSIRTRVVYQNLGTVRYNLADYQGAIEAWATASELDPSTKGEMLNNMGNAYRESGRQSEAERHYRSALEVEATRWTAAINLASLLMDQGKPTEAVAILDSAQRSNPDITPLARLLQRYRSEAGGEKK